jgi:hypothetical protein
MWKGPSSSGTKYHVCYSIPSSLGPNDTHVIIEQPWYNTCWCIPTPLALNTISLSTPTQCRTHHIYKSVHSKHCCCCIALWEMNWLWKTWFRDAKKSNDHVLKCYKATKKHVPCKRAAATWPTPTRPSENWHLWIKSLFLNSHFERHITEQAFF